MNVRALAETGIADAWRSGSAIVVSAGLIALGLLFHSEVVAAVTVWQDSTAYNHCFLVIPIVLYLIWDRRGTLRDVSASPYPVAVLAGVPLAIVWLLAERLGIMEGRQLVAMSFVELLFFVVLGPRLWWLLAGPLLYLYFLVPFGAFLTPKLQDITTVFVAHGLPILGIPAYITGYTIEIPEGTFLIAEACAGLRFLIAAIAFGEQPGDGERHARKGRQRIRGGRYIVQRVTTVPDEIENNRDHQEAMVVRGRVLPNGNRRDDLAVEQQPEHDETDTDSNGRTAAPRIDQPCLGKRANIHAGRTAWTGSGRATPNNRSSGRNVTDH